MNTAVKESFAHLSGLSAAAAKFTADFKFEDISAEALRLSRRCILDGLSVSLGDPRGAVERRGTAHLLGGGPAGVVDLLQYVRDGQVFLRRHFAALAFLSALF